MVFYWKANIYIFWFVFSRSTRRAHANSSLGNCIHGLNANQFTDLPILTRTQNDSGSVPVPRTLFCTSALVRFGSHLLNSRLITKCFVSSDAAVGSADECTACGATLNWAIIAVVVRDALSRMCGYLCDVHRLTLADAAAAHRRWVSDISAAKLTVPQRYSCQHAGTSSGGASHKNWGC